MDECEQEWIVIGMAWAGLRHWVYGREAGEAARAVISAAIDARRSGRHITPDLERLERELFARLVPGGLIPGPQADAEMPKFRAPA